MQVAQTRAEGYEGAEKLGVDLWVPGNQRGWHKGALIVVLMGLMEDRFGKEGFFTQRVFWTFEFEGGCCCNRQSMLCCSCNTAVTFGCIPMPLAQQATMQGLKFLRWCQDLPYKSHQHGKVLFILQPKARAFHHLCLDRCQNKARCP